MSLRPSSFPGDAYGYACNQAGHAYFVGIIGALIFAGYGMAAPFIVGAAYAALWEWGYQRWRWRDLFDWRDSLEDSIHVTVGAAVVAALLAGDLRTVWHVLELQAVLLLAGVWRRKA